VSRVLDGPSVKPSRTAPPIVSRMLRKWTLTALGPIESAEAISLLA
jgi:hypothetical protein